MVCSTCKRARGVRTESKKVKCTKCGAAIDVGQAKAYFSTDSERELARGVAEQNARLQGEGTFVHPDDPASRRTVEELILEALEKDGDLTLGEAMEIVAVYRDVPLEAIGHDEVLRLLDGLKDKGLIFEQRDGYFKKV